MGYTRNEYQKMYGTDIIDDIRYAMGINKGELPTQEVLLKIREEIEILEQEAASTHFGQPYLNTATMAGIYRMMIKHFLNENNKN